LYLRAAQHIPLIGYIHLILKLLGPATEARSLYLNLVSSEPLQFGIHIQEVVCRVVTLLEVADRELGQTQEAAKTAITHAASILIAEIGHSAPTRPRTAGAGPLLRWQASRVQEYIERNIAQAIRVSDLSALVSRTEAHFSPGSSCPASQEASWRRPHVHRRASIRSRGLDPKHA